MAGNRTVFEAAMKRAAEHAWNQRWDLALADYQIAANEFEDDMAARGNLALAYYRLGTWERALEHYTWMLDHAPENAFIMDRLIEVYLKLEMRSDAKRMQARLDALNQKLRQATGAFTGTPPTGGTGTLPPGTGHPVGGAASTRMARATGALETGRERPLTSNLTVFELNEMVALAMAYEESGKVTEAIRHYEQAVAAGLDRTDAFYSLGLLYQQLGRHQEALAKFAHCLDDADYAMSSTYATGVSLRALGQPEDSARMLSLAVSLIDHEQIGPAEIDELIVIYRTAIEALVEVNNHLQAANLATGLATFLHERGGFEAQAEEFRALARRFQASLTTSLGGAAPPLAESAPPAGASADSPAAPATGGGVAPPWSGQRPGRPVIAAPADEEAPERLTTSYRRVTGGLAGEQRRITGGLAGTPRRVTGRLGPESRPAPAPPADAPTRPMVGRSTMLLSERTTVLFTDRSTGAMMRRRLHAHGGPLPGLEQQAEEVRLLAAEADANAAAGHLLGAFDACRAIVGLAPRFVAVFLRLAELHARRGELVTALDLTQSALRVLECRVAPAAERVPFLRLLVRLRPGDEAALTNYVNAAHEAGLASTAAPLVRRLVWRLLGRGATSRALSEAERLAAACPDDLAAQLHHADTLLLLGQAEPALEVYRRVLAQVPAHIGATAGANIAFALLGQEALWWSSLESLVAASRAADAAGTVPLHLYRRLATSPAAPHLRTAAGLLLLTLGRPLDARDWLAPVLDAPAPEPRSRAIVLHAAALVAHALGEASEERAHRQATLDLLTSPALAAGPAMPRLFEQPFTPGHLGLALADLLARENDLASAIQTLDHLRGSGHGDEPVLSRLAELHLANGRLGAALAALDELASHHRDSGRLDQMAGVLDRMSRLAPGNVGVKTRLIDAYLERGFVEQARRELELRADLQASAGKLAGAIASLQKAADISWTMGRIEEAFALCERMIALQPANIGSRQYLTTLYLQAGHLDRAVEQTWELARMHIAEANHRDAIAALHQIIGLSPTDETAHHKLGEALAAIGEYAQAERVYRRLARQNPDDPIARAKLLAMATLTGNPSASPTAA